MRAALIRSVCAECCGLVSGSVCVKYAGAELVLCEERSMAAEGNVVVAAE